MTVASSEVTCKASVRVLKVAPTLKYLGDTCDLKAYAEHTTAHDTVYIGRQWVRTLNSVTAAGAMSPFGAFWHMNVHT